MLVYNKDSVFEIGFLVVLHIMVKILCLCSKKEYKNEFTGFIRQNNVRNQQTNISK